MAETLPMDSATASQAAALLGGAGVEPTTATHTLKPASMSSEDWAFHTQKTLPLSDEWLEEVREMQLEKKRDAENEMELGQLAEANLAEANDAEIVPSDLVDHLTTTAMGGEVTEREAVGGEEPCLEEAVLPTQPSPVEDKELETPSGHRSESEPAQKKRKALDPVGDKEFKQKEEEDGHEDGVPNLPMVTREHQQAFKAGKQRVSKLKKSQAAHADSKGQEKQAASGHAGESGQGRGRGEECGRGGRGRGRGRGRRGKRGPADQDEAASAEKRARRTMKRPAAAKPPSPSCPPRCLEGEFAFVASSSEGEPEIKVELDETKPRPSQAKPGKGAKKKSPDPASRDAKQPKQEEKAKKKPDDPAAAPAYEGPNSRKTFAGRRPPTRLAANARFLALAKVYNDIILPKLVVGCAGTKLEAAAFSTCLSFGATCVS